MIQSPARHVALPAFIGSVVLLLGLSLATIVARGPYTHANLNLAFDPAYSRTDQAFVGAPIPFTGGMLAVQPAADPVERGRQLFVGYGCATCHGLDGNGGAVGPSLAGKSAAKLATKTQVGPKGMPAFAPGALSTDDLAAIAAFLDAPAK